MLCEVHDPLCAAVVVLVVADHHVVVPAVGLSVHPGRQHLQIVLLHSVHLQKQDFRWGAYIRNEKGDKYTFVPTV